MRFISHRGNLTGRIPEAENKLDYIKRALRAGFDVEIDVWRWGEKLLLGHDTGIEPVSRSFLFLNSRRLWIHCKNSGAYESLKWLGGFEHLAEPFVDVKTPIGRWRWHHSSNLDFQSNSICVMPEGQDGSVQAAFEKAGGICSDVIWFIKNNHHGYKQARSSNS